MRSNAFTSALASSALAACFQAATDVPFATPAKRYARDCNSSHSRAAERRARIQMRGRAGMSPIGRNPPSALKQDHDHQAHNVRPPPGGFARRKQLHDSEKEAVRKSQKRSKVQCVRTKSRLRRKSPKGARNMFKH